MLIISIIISNIIWLNNDKTVFLKLCISNSAVKLPRNGGGFFKNRIRCI